MKNFSELSLGEQSALVAHRASGGVIEVSVAGRDFTVSKGDGFFGGFFYRIKPEPEPKKEAMMIVVRIGNAQATKLGGSPIKRIANTPTVMHLDSVSAYEQADKICRETGDKVLLFSAVAEFTSTRSVSVKELKS